MAKDDLSQAADVGNLGGRRGAGERGAARRARRARPRAGGGAVSQGLRLGRRDGQLSGRGGRGRGRQGAVGVGRLLQAEGRHLRRQHRRRRLRPLPPLQGGRGAHQGAGRQVVSLQRLLAARAAERDRRLQPEGARLLQPPHRRARGARDRAARHDLPLGLSAGALQEGRLAEPRFGRLVRRVHQPPGRQVLGPGQGLGDA